MASKETEKWFDSVNMDELTDVSEAFLKAIARFGTEIPEFDEKCPSGKKCKTCRGKGFYTGEYRGEEGIDLVCPEIAGYGFTPQQWMDRKLGVPVWLWRIRKLTETDAWKLWSMEGCFDSKYYKTLEPEDNMQQEILLAEAKFGANSVMIVGGNMIFIKNEPWEKYNKKKGSL